MTSNLRRLVAVSALLALALAACGGGGSGNDADPTTTAPEATTTTTADSEGTDGGESDGGESDGGTSDDPEALAQARAAALTVDDLPEGWTMTAEEENADDFAGDENEGVLEDLCPEVKDEIDAIRAEAGDPADVSRDFEPAGGMPAVQSSPDVFGDEALATRAFEVMMSEELAQCTGDMFAELMRTEQGADVGDVDISELKVDAGDADRAGGMSIRLSVTADGQTADMQIDLVLVQAGPILHSLMAMTVDGIAPFPEMEDVVDAAVRRTVAAAAGA